MPRVQKTHEEREERDSPFVADRGVLPMLHARVAVSLIGFGPVEGFDIPLNPLFLLGICGSIGFLAQIEHDFSQCASH